jgi:hypothetical protein
MGCQYHESFIVIKNKLNMSRIFSSLNASFAVPWGRDVNNKKYTSHNRNYQGIFLIIRINLSTNPVSLFLFYNTKSELISHYKIHFGESYYKNFTSFIVETLKETKFNDKEVRILAPKYFINPLLINKCNTMFGVLLIPYSRKNQDLPSVINVIKRGVRGIKNWDKESFELWVKNYNLNNISYKGYIARALEPYSLKRMYSTVLQIRDKQYNEINKWKSYKAEIADLRTDNTINHLIDKFWADVVLKELKTNTNLKIALQLRVQFENLEMRSLSYLDTIVLSDFNWLCKAFTYCYTGALDAYNLPDFKKLIIVYKICPEDYKRNLSTKTFEQERKKSGYTHTLMGYNIPSLMDFKKWGPATLNINTNVWTVQLSEKRIAEISTRYNENIVYIIRKSLEGKKILFSFIDKVRHSSFNKKTLKFSMFERSFKNKSIIFKDGKEVIRTEEIDTKFIGTIKKEGKPNKKIITMDLETRVLDDKLCPICVSIYDGQNKSTFWVGDFISPEAMLEESIRSILIRKYRGYKIYLHNFSYFDGVFLLKVLAQMSGIKITPLVRDDRILRIVMQFDLKGGKGAVYRNSVTIYDSLLLLPVSLEKLAKTFNCEAKGMFPLKFVNNPAVPLDYCGEVPGLKYHYHPDPLTAASNFEKFKKKFDDYILSYNQSSKWDLKKELIEYCEQDVVVLHQVITKFSDEIYNKFKINISRYPTLTSIAFAIYRSIFMPKDTIPILLGGIYNDIKQAFYGGFVDVYKVSGENVNGYDVNSLYPSSMRNCAVPVGKPIFFTGDPLIKFSQFFGFAYVEVQAPLDLKNPILPFKIENSNGSTSTINGVGNWRGWYFSEEIKNAEKYGYKFKIIKGYQFQQKKIFTKYVEELYAIKCGVSPDNPWYTIAKLLLNGLFGRFGMDPEMDTAEIIGDEDFDSLHKSGLFTIKDRLNLGEKTLVIYEDNEKESYPNISIAVSAAISSYSRIHMTRFITKYSDSICYIDTDGIKTSSVIDKQEIGSELGKMKFEGSFKEAIFIAPKVYAGVSTDSSMTVKVKGLKGSISYWLMKQLLYIPKLDIPQERMLREWDKGYISILKGVYTLSATENKRVLVRDSCGKIIGTSPYELKDGVKIKKSKFILYYLPTLLVPSQCLALPAPYQYLALPAPYQYLALPVPFKETFLSLPSNNIIYLPQPVPYIIRIYPSLPSVIFIPPHRHFSS